MEFTALQRRVTELITVLISPFGSFATGHPQFAVTNSFFAPIFSLSFRLLCEYVLAFPSISKSNSVSQEM